MSRRKKAPWSMLEVATMPGATIGISPAEEAEARHEMRCACKDCMEALLVRADEVANLLSWDVKGLRPV
ncbi:hypothetical protein [Ferrovibrio sp.]|uniref:hypothetical protein n=1 Tax=Ferrovibrio sp. TaxID=1917215 RepID=UPI00311E39B6